MNKLLGDDRDIQGNVKNQRANNETGTLIEEWLAHFWWVERFADRNGRFTGRSSTNRNSSNFDEVGNINTLELLMLTLGKVVKNVILET
jgi:hypothetical protein